MALVGLGWGVKGGVERFCLSRENCFASRGRWRNSVADRDAGRRGHHGVSVVFALAAANRPQWDVCAGGASRTHPTSVMLHPWQGPKAHFPRTPPHRAAEHSR